MMKCFQLLLASTLLFSFTGAVPQSIPNPDPSSVVQGKPFVQALCTTCHSKMVIDNAHKNRAAWAKTLEKMEGQGLAKLPKAIESSILDYLQMEHGEEKEASRENKGPWADRRNANPLW